MKQLRGGDLGYELVHAAIDYARIHQYKVIPLCRFAQAVLEKSPSLKMFWHDGISVLLKTVNQRLTGIILDVIFS